MKETSMSSRAGTIISDINQGKLVTLRGAHGLALARVVLQEAVRAAGARFVFDPQSAADLIDYLTVAGTSALDGATLGAGVGAVLGLLVKRPAQGAAIGMGLGLLGGLARGADRVQGGWRVRAIRGSDGAPNVTLGLSGSTWT